MKSARRDPIIIQGGMGAGVSSWQLARAVSTASQLGVVSGTALDTILVRRLQLGDPGGHMRRALDAFPLPEMSEWILHRYYIENGKQPGATFQAIPLLSEAPSQQQLELLVVANFVEVFLAKEGHHGLVGINYLEKIQLPTVPSLFGALIAKVDYVLMGAGIPTAIPGVIDKLCSGDAVELTLRVDGAGPDAPFHICFDPREFTRDQVPWLEKPKFLPIVASATLASMLAKKASGPVDGFVVEGPTAGGHNAPPRGQARFNERGEPIYGQRDVIDLAAMRAIGLPFWLAGSYGSAEQVVNALDAGAAGVQVGTAFAFAEESGLRDDLKKAAIRLNREGRSDVITDPVASPTGFPFKVLQLEGTMSEPAAYHDRQRRCDLGYLRQAYKNADGTLGWRCPAESVHAYVRKGGLDADAHGRKCVCNALLANIDLAQTRGTGETEKPLITCGDDVKNIHRFLPHPGASSYSAVDVIRQLLTLIDAKENVPVSCQPACP